MFIDIVFVTLLKLLFSLKFLFFSKGIVFFKLELYLLLLIHFKTGQHVMVHDAPDQVSHIFKS